MACGDGKHNDEKDSKLSDFGWLETGYVLSDWSPSGGIQRNGGT